MYGVFYDFSEILMVSRFLLKLFSSVQIFFLLLVSFLPYASMHYTYAAGPVVNFDVNGISDCPFPNGDGATGPGTCGAGHMAPYGNGKYRGDVYWLDWGRKNTKLKNGDYTLFKTPSGTVYKIVLQNLVTQGGKPWL